MLAFLRELLATSVLLPSAYYSAKRKGSTNRQFLPHAEDISQFILLGFLMIWGVQLLSAISLQHITAGNYSLLAPTVPVFTLAIALATGYEHFNRKSTISWMKIGSIGVTVAGAVYIAVAAFVASKPTVDNGVYKNPLVGNALLLANKLCVSTYPILEKKLMKKYAPQVIVAWGYFFGALLTFMSVVPCVINPAAWQISSSGVGAILYSGLLSSGLNYSLMAAVNQRTSPVFVMACYPLQSVLTPLLAWVLLGAPVSGNDIGGGIVICIGLALLLVARVKEHASLPPAGGAPSTSPAPSTDAALGDAPLAEVGQKDEWDTGAFAYHSVAPSTPPVYPAGASVSSTVGQPGAAAPDALSLELPVAGSGSAHHASARSEWDDGPAAVVPAASAPATR